MSTAIKNGVTAKELQTIEVDAPSKNTLTEEVLIKMVNERFNLVATKSAMLKLIRSEGYSVAQNRCYNAYLRIQRIVESKKVEVAEEIAPTKKK